MGVMGKGYGSECHLLRFLGRHRQQLDRAVAGVTGAQAVGWLDAPFDAGSPWLDGEWKGLDFLAPGSPALEAWRACWPRRGNPPNWDAVGQVVVGGRREWLLVEAKGNVEELGSSCGASPRGGRPLIKETLDATKAALGVPADRDWLNGYYQYCNRLAVLRLLVGHGEPARLLFIYLTGDRTPGRECPATAKGWQAALDKQQVHVGLPSRHALADRVHQLFLDVRGGSD